MGTLKLFGRRMRDTPSNILYDAEHEGGRLPSHSQFGKSIVPKKLHYVLEICLHELGEDKLREMLGLDPDAPFIIDEWPFLIDIQKKSGIFTVVLCWQVGEGTAFAFIHVTREQADNIFAAAELYRQEKEGQDQADFRPLRIHYAVSKAGFDERGLEERRAKALKDAGLDDASVAAKIEEITQRVDANIAAKKKMEED